jgi:hypothetical protein
VTWLLIKHKLTCCISKRSCDNTAFVRCTAFIR